MNRSMTNEQSGVPILLSPRTVDDRTVTLFFTSKHALLQTYCDSQICAAVMTRDLFSRQANRFAQVLNRLPVDVD